ncbi:MAG TPA: ABC transporter permease [Bryobacteraceae bacterium]|nr:ABC transporter permease [Bryobacteraceae bacterium]
MRRNVGFTSIAIVTLALATGALTTVFNLANDFLFRPLPAEHPNELVRVSATRRHGSINAPVSWPDYVRFRDHTTTLAGLAAHYPTAPLFVSVRNNAQEINGSVVSANYFPLLGIQPLLGRFFRPAEDAVPDRDRVAVISYALWSRWFGASPDALGAAVRINSVPFTVIGAAPRNFRGVISAPSEIYIPAMMLGVGYRWCDDSLSEDCTILSMLGRMAAGRTVQEVGAEIASLMPPRWEHAEEGDNSGTVVRSDRGADRSETTMLLMRLLLLVGLVLLAVNCANLAGMALARGAARTRESAVRVSLGAGRFRLMRQLLSESVLLALAGGAGGILFSLALTGALQQMFFSLDDEGHPLWYDFTIEPWVILTVLAVCVLAGLGFGSRPPFAPRAWARSMG